MLDEYTHSTLVTCFIEHNGDDEPHDSSVVSTPIPLGLSINCVFLSCQTFHTHTQISFKQKKKTIIHWFLNFVFSFVYKKWYYDLKRIWRCQVRSSDWKLAILTGAFGLPPSVRANSGILHIQYNVSVKHKQFFIT